MRSTTQRREHICSELLETKRQREDEMENMAAMLSEVAGGLQQSFGSVFERVGQSLEQSAQMMQMMNGMMEAALLQNLIVTYTVEPSKIPQADASSLRYDACITVENRSQIALSEVVVVLQFGEDESTTEDVEKAERTLEQGLGASSSAHVALPLPRLLVGRLGAITLNVKSPGTQQWISKDVLFRIPVLKMATIEAIATPSPTADSLVHDQSDRVPITALRDALRVTAFDPLLSSPTGHYRVGLAAGILGASSIVFNLSIHQTTESETGARIIVSTETSSEQAKTAKLQHWCRLFIEELESL